MITDFLFDDQRLSDFGYMIGSLGGVNDETVVVSNMDYTEFKSPRTDISHKVATSYPDNYSTTIQIFKKVNCQNPSTIADEDALTPNDISTLTKWLCRKDYHQFKWIDNYDSRYDPVDVNAGISNIVYNVRFHVSKLMVLGMCMGLELTINTDKPYGYAANDAGNETTISSAYGTISINMYGDEEGFIYPDVEVTLSAGGAFRLTNTTIGTSTEVLGCTAGEKLTFKGGDLLQITSDVPSHDLATKFDYQFPKLYNDYASSASTNPYVNVLESSLPCHIKVSYKEIRKVGIGI